MLRPWVKWPFSEIGWIPRLPPSPKTADGRQIPQLQHWLFHKKRFQKGFPLRTSPQDLHLRSNQTQGASGIWKWQQSFPSDLNRNQGLIYDKFASDKHRINSQKMENPKSQLAFWDLFTQNVKNFLILESLISLTNLVSWLLNFFTTSALIGVKPLKWSSNSSKPTERTPIH